MSKMRFRVWTMVSFGITTDDERTSTKFPYHERSSTLEQHSEDRVDDQFEMLLVCFNFNTRCDCSGAIFIERSPSAINDIIANTRNIMNTTISLASESVFSTISPGAAARRIRSCPPSAFPTACWSIVKKPFS